MPTVPHVERHFRAAAVVRDLVIGMSDGLTVPFALTAGLSEAVTSTAVVVTAGLAEIAAGAIAMGLGGYLAARADRNRWVDFMMRFELGLEAPNPARARQSALTIAGAYVAGGLVPLAPYVLLADRGLAFGVSVGVTLAALFGFGVAKGRFTGLSPLRGGLQTLLTGGLAAAAAFTIARLVS